jgi:hypothetical protein
MQLGTALAPFDVPFWAIMERGGADLETTLQPVADVLAIDCKKLAKQHTHVFQWAKAIVQGGVVEVAGPTGGRVGGRTDGQTDGQMDGEVDQVWLAVMKRLQERKMLGSFDELCLAVFLLWSVWPSTGSIESSLGVLQQLSEGRHGKAGLPFLRARLKINMDGPEVVRAHTYLRMLAT